MPDTQPRPFISVVMGSVSDWTVMKRAVEMLRHFDVRVETRVISAHRMPDQMFAYAQSAQERGLAAIIAGAGGAAHLPGMLAAKTTAPVLGVPIPGPHLQGIDALHSIVQMPKGIPVAAFAIGEAGAANAALFAIAMLGRAFPALARQLDAFRQQQTEKACAMTLPPVSARAAQSEFSRLHVRISYAHPAHRLAGHTRRRPVRPHVLFCRAAAGISRLRVRSRPSLHRGRCRGCASVRGYEDEAALVEFGQRCAAISTEFENIPAHCLEFLARLACVRPGAHCLAIAQDRAAEKRFIADCGVLVAPYRVIASVSALAALTPADLTAVLPGILKTARLGYDGKGQVHVKDADELRRAY